MIGDYYDLTKLKEYNAELRAEVERLNKALELACKEVVEVDEKNCPGCAKKNRLLGVNCEIIPSNYYQCWITHFIQKALAAKEG